ncbi:MAG: carboxypeptidase regulatory-like domain-containing protein [Saprospiraceae bacterium]
MKKVIKLSFIFVLFSFTFVAKHEKPLNQVRGKIKLRECSDTIGKGVGYNKDGTEILHSNDPMAKPEMNVIVSLHPLDFTPELTPTPDAIISQKEQTFLPLVLPVVVGSKVHFLNEDEFFHNVQSYTPKSRFSIGRRAPGISYSQKIIKAGVINLLCDIHSHMNAVILSLETPYFVRTAANGTFSLDGLPNGRYRLNIFHPNCGEITDEITLSGGEVFTVDYDYSVKP